MLGLLAAALLAAPLDIVPINDGNALTLPAGRHLVRLDPQNGRPATWLLAVQQDGRDGRGLGWYRSDDEARSFTYYAPIQNDASHTDRVDLIPVGMDIALVYSYEGPTVYGSARHNVWFQWWRWDGNANWNPSAPVLVLASAGDSGGYLRGEIARDSLGRIWVNAVRIEPDGTFTVCMAVSTNGGQSFSEQPSLAHYGTRPGGRLLSLGGRMMLLYGTHGVDAGQMRLRNDSDPLDQWGAEITAFPEGLYHGAALSAVADGSGGVHMVYKDLTERTYYRYFNGSSWGNRVPVESTQDWATQTATTLIGQDLVIFWNHPVSTNTDYRYRSAIVHNGALGPVVTLDDTSGFKGYPAAAERLPASVPYVPCFYGRTPDANTNGYVALVHGENPAATAPPVVPDGGTPDAGTAPDAGIVPPPPPPQGTLFSDSFNRNASDLGAAWTVVQGAFIVDGRANTDLNGADRAVVKGLSCADCSVSADVVGFGDPAELDLRVNGDDRYDLTLVASGHVQLRKHKGGVVTVLADAPSGIADVGDWANLALTVSGTSAVSLSGAVNGRVLLTARDASSVLGAGGAGLAATIAGVWFKNFTVQGAAGAPDAGTPDAGTPDAGTPDAGTPDAGTPDAGTSDAGTPDAGTPDAGTPDAGPPPPAPGGTLFTDSFNRTANDLGPAWTIRQGAFIATGYANSDNDAPDQAFATGLSCADCTVTADVVGFGDPVAVDLRVTGDDRYDFVLIANGHVQIRKHKGGVVTVLADAPSGIVDTSAWSTLSLTAQGSGPVALTGRFNGRALLNATDASAVLGAGSAGFSATISGIWFANFIVTGAPGAGGTPDAGTPDAGPPDAGTPDAGTPDAGTPDAGTPDAGTPDAGTPDGGVVPDGGTALTATITYTGVDYDILAVDNRGVAIGNKIGDWTGNVYSSVDGRSWTPTGSSGNGYDFRIIAPLSDGTLLADTFSGDQHVMERSADHGSTWTDVLPTDRFYALSPHSYAELDGAVYFLEYQVFTQNDTPIRIWKSIDRGRTWTTAYTFQGHRHGHGLAPDPAHHALWAFFGDTDAQSGAYRSTDGGASWTLIVPAQTGGIVDATVLPDGSLLCGQDITYLPQYPNIARLGLDGSVTNYLVLPGPSYSTHTVKSGGYVLGVTRENGGDVYPPGFDSGQLWGSGDGVHWSKLLDVPVLSHSEDTRTDVYFELSTGELVVNVKNAAGYGADGRGYVLMTTKRK